MTVGTVSNDYGGAYAQQTAKNRQTDGSFAGQLANTSLPGSPSNPLVLHGSTDSETGEKCVGAWADVQAGTSVSIYQPVDYDESHPTYHLKIWDREGNVTERTVDISKVDPANSDYYDMYAYTSHLGRTGECPEAQMRFMMAQAHAQDSRGWYSAAALDAAVNWMDVIRAAMQEQYTLGNLDGYLGYKRFLEFLQGDDDVCPQVKNTGTNTRRIYGDYQSQNYTMKADNENQCLDIYTADGERIGAFSYSDLKVRRDSATGTEVLLSAYGTGAGMYNVIPMDAELRLGLQKIMGVETLETEPLSGFTVKTHAGTGIQYVLRDGAEGRGGKVLLRSEADAAKYEALAEEYCRNYPNLVPNMEYGRIYASFEIFGMAERTKSGFVRIGYDNISYNDNDNYKKNWSVRLTGDTWELLYEWLENNRAQMEEMQKFQSWEAVFRELGGTYERIWSDEEEKQGYLNN